MKIRELLILLCIDPKTQKRRTASKKCCGWEIPAICEIGGIPRESRNCAHTDSKR